MGEKSSAFVIIYSFFIGVFTFCVNGLAVASCDSLSSDFVFSTGQIVSLSRYVRLFLGQQMLPFEKHIVLKKSRNPKTQSRFSPG